MLFLSEVLYSQDIKHTQQGPDLAICMLTQLSAYSDDTWLDTWAPRIPSSLSEFKIEYWNYLVSISLYLVKPKVPWGREDDFVIF